MGEDADLIVDVCEGVGVILWSMRGVADSVVVEVKSRGVLVKCVWSDGVDECEDVLDDRRGTGVGEGELSCKSV